MTLLTLCIKVVNIGALINFAAQIDKNRVFYLTFRLSIFALR